MRGRHQDLQPQLPVDLFCRCSEQNPKRRCFVGKIGSSADRAGYQGEEIIWIRAGGEKIRQCLNLKERGSASRSTAENQGATWLYLRARTAKPLRVADPRSLPRLEVGNSFPLHTRPGHKPPLFLRLHIGWK